MTRFMLIFALLYMPSAAWSVTITLEITGEIVATNAFHSRSGFAAGDQVSLVALLESGPAEAADGAGFFWDGVEGSETALTISSATGAYNDIEVTTGPIRLSFPPVSGDGTRSVAFTLGERETIEARLFHPGPFFPETWDKTDSITTFGADGTSPFRANLFLNGTGFPASNDWGICFTICILRSELTQFAITPDLPDEPSPVPLPTAAPLLAIALAITGAWSRRRPAALTPS